MVLRPGSSKRTQRTSKRSWWITITPAKSGEVVAWASDAAPPRDATVVSMFHLPGEVHFAIGKTAADARDRLEQALPPDHNR